MTKRLGFDRRNTYFGITPMMTLAVVMLPLWGSLRPASAATPVTAVTSVILATDGDPWWTPPAEYEDALQDFWSHAFGLTYTPGRSFLNLGSGSLLAFDGSIPEAFDPDVPEGVAAWEVEGTWDVTGSGFLEGDPEEILSQRVVVGKVTNTATSWDGHVIGYWIRADGGAWPDGVPARDRRVTLEQILPLKVCASRDAALAEAEDLAAFMEEGPEYNGIPQATCEGEPARGGPWTRVYPNDGGGGGGDHCAAYASCARSCAFLFAAEIAACAAAFASCIGGAIVASRLCLAAGSPAGLAACYLVLGGLCLAASLLCKAAATFVWMSCRARCLSALQAATTNWRDCFPIGPGSPARQEFTRLSSDPSMPRAVRCFLRTIRKDLP